MTARGFDPRCLAGQLAGHWRLLHALTQAISSSPNVSSRCFRPRESMTDRHGDTSIDPQVLDSGRDQDVCPECGTPIVGGSPDDGLGTACACQARRTYRYLTELVCTLCSRE